MEQKATTPEPRASSTWDRLEDFVREHVQRFIQALLEEKGAELLPAVYAGTRYVNGIQPTHKAQQRIAA